MIDLTGLQNSIEAEIRDSMTYDDKEKDALLSKLLILTQAIQEIQAVLPRKEHIE